MFCSISKELCPVVFLLLVCFIQRSKSNAGGWSLLNISLIFALFLRWKTKCSQKSGRAPWRWRSSDVRLEWWKNNQTPVFQINDDISQKPAAGCPYSLITVSNFFGEVHPGTISIKIKSSLAHNLSIRSLTELHMNFKMASKKTRW